MDKYLQEMLLEMNMIIIPGLGALSMVNRATGEIMFMPYLKHDDHVLAKHIAAKEGWEENDAVNLIAKYVREIEAKLNIGESYDMYRFGSFKKDNTGDVNFEAWIGESPSVVNVSTTPLAEVSDVESVGVIEEQIVSEPVIEKAEELAIETIIEAVPEPIIIQVEPAEVIVEEEVQPIITIEADSIEVIEPVSEFEEAEKTATEINPIIEKEAIIEEVETIQYTEEDQWKDDLDLPPINAKIERPKKPIIEKAKSDKKKRHPAFYILTVLIVILIGGSVTVGVFYDQLKQHLPFVAQETSKVEEKPSATEENKVIKEEEKDVEPKVEEESIIEETLTEAEPKEEIVNSAYIQTSTGRVNPTQPYHVIAGAFREKANAERFRDRLRENGNSNSEIIGEFDGLFIVSASSHQSMEEAQNSRKSNSTITQSWIFRWP
ncbi:MAG: SPOR domain-containing protein [Crocinitomicaceae bacterium]|jgi:cell division protein FtsN|nr:SPOR domain-containing protein [Crocinitomicaceae bacterium]MDP4865400.1 SPOR domain-containing protein [Crocinitomicaceae bacterium]MDP5009882.1 SPOR domain-containing protein [Crocinitomicaceae bacterium]